MFRIVRPPGIWLFATMCLLILASPLSTSALPTASWGQSGNDVGNSRNQPNETVLTASTVGGLVSKWTDASRNISATPSVYGGSVYVPDWGGKVYRFDASTGAIKWVKSVASYNGISGTLSRTTPAVYSDTVILGDMPATSWTSGNGAHVIAIRQNTGALRWITQVDSHPYSLITQSPVVYNGVVYVGVSSAEETAGAIHGYVCCTFQGSVVALNAATGQLIWKTNTVPLGYSGGAVWSSMPTVDATRQSLYVGTGNNYSVPASVGACLLAHPGSWNCTAPDDHFDSVLSLNLQTGAVNWSRRLQQADVFPSKQCGTACPRLDYDFGSTGNLFTGTISGTVTSLVGIGQKSGFYFALDTGTGSVAWQTQVGPGSGSGGVMWGTATDGQRIYVADANGHHQQYTLVDGTSVTGGIWSALDPSTGAILWQTGDPLNAEDPGPPSVANGVVYVGSMDPNGHLYALDASTGAILWSYATGANVNAGAAIVNGMVYWGSGYSPITSTVKLYAFGLP